VIITAAKAVWLSLAFIKNQKFGVLASILASLTIWLLTAQVVHCFTDNSGFLCKQDSLGSYLVAHKSWPYQHAPVFGYWDSYDNKLAVFIEEPYYLLFITTALAYLVWFRIVVYAYRHQREKKAVC